MSPLGTPFTPGDGFFDHFDLLTLEHADFYPDGRDLGENYTYTSWRMSRCVQSGGLDCRHCHTSSGRYNFSAAKSESGLPALPRRQGGQRPGPHLSQGRGGGQSLRGLPHAHHRLRGHDADRSFDAAADARRHAGLPIAQRLQRLPHG